MNERKHKYTNWSYDPAQDRYHGCFEIAGHLPAGMYSVSTDSFNNPVAYRDELKEEQSYVFASGPMKEAMAEVGSFWDSAGHYKKLGVPHKRGILLHGPPGCGKTMIVFGIIKKAIADGGIVIQMDPPISELSDALPLMRQIEVDRPITVLLEDLERFCHEGQEEMLLEMLDGASSLGHGILYLATTNHTDKIPERVRSRPSRIDTLIEVPLPSPQQRMEYLKFLCRGDYMPDSATLDELVRLSQGFSLASLKELVLSLVVYRRPLDVTIARLRDVSGTSDKAEKPTDSPVPDNGSVEDWERRREEMLVANE